MNKITGGNYVGARIRLGINGSLKMSYKGRTSLLAPSIKKVKSLGGTRNSADVAQNAFLLGTAFAVAAAAKGIWLVEIHFKSGKKSVAEVDDRIYRALMSQATGMRTEDDLPPADSTSNIKRALMIVFVIILIWWLMSSIFSGGESKPQWQKDVDTAMRPLSSSEQLEIAQSIFLEANKKDGAFTMEQYKYMSKTYNITCKYKNKKKDIVCSKAK